MGVSRANAADDGSRHLISGALPPPVIVQPAEIAELREGNNIKFSWLGVKGAVSYHFLLARDRRFKNVVENTYIKGTFYTVGNTNYGTYFVKISSVSAAHFEGSFSPRRSFIVVPSPPAGVSPGELQGKNQPN